MTAPVPSATPPTAPPSNARRGPIASAAVLVIIAAYFVALHLLIASRSMPRTSLALALAPWVLAWLSLCARTGPQRMPLRLPTSIRFWLASLLVVVMGVVAWRFGDAFALRFDVVLYLENLAFHLFLSLVFAITLLPGREALITRLARAVRGAPLSVAAKRYTRAATAAWALFFVAVASLSTWLFVTQRLEVWSLFVNVLIWPSVVAMFVGEYAVRLRMLPDDAHVSIFASMRAFSHRDPS